MSQIKLILTIRSLNIGGTERQFIELIKGINKIKFDVVVCTMFRGTSDFELKNVPNIQFICFEKKSRYDVFSYYKYINLILKFKPDIIYSFLSDSNLISLICSKIAFSNCGLIWGIRGSITDLNMYGYFLKLIFNLQKKFSSQIDLIIYNSYSSEKGHKQIGFRPKQSSVIQNGIDSIRFNKSKEIRENFRSKYGIKENDIVIGITSRIDPIKGYNIFCKAAVQLLNKYNNIIFFSIGYGITEIQKECEKILGNYNQTKFYWLGKQMNPENFMPGWDIYCSASLPGEGFPNAIAEAMLSELAPVVTDSGDSGNIVDEIGLVAKCSDVSDLKLQLENMILDPQLIEIGKKSRNKILEDFSINKMVSKTEDEIIKNYKIR